MIFNANGSFREGMFSNGKEHGISNQTNADGTKER